MKPYALLFLLLSLALLFTANHFAPKGSGETQQQTK